MRDSKQIQTKELHIRWFRERRDQSIFPRLGMVLVERTYQSNIYIFPWFEVQHHFVHKHSCLVPYQAILIRKVSNHFLTLFNINCHSMSTFSVVTIRSDSKSHSFVNNAIVMKFFTRTEIVFCLGMIRECSILKRQQKTEFAPATVKQVLILLPCLSWPPCIRYNDGYLLIRVKFMHLYTQYWLNITFAFLLSDCDHSESDNLHQLLLS